MKGSRGFTLVELMTAVSLVVLVVFVLHQPVENAINNYKVQLAVEQSQQDLKLLELIRRSEHRKPGFQALAGLSKNQVVVDYAGATLFGNLLAGDGVDNSMQADAATYTVDNHLAQVTIQLEQLGNEVYEFYAAESQAVQVDVPGPDPGTTKKVTRVEVSLNYRETDPLILDYVIDSYHMR